MALESRQNFISAQYLLNKGIYVYQILYNMHGYRQNLGDFLANWQQRYDP